MIVIDTEFNRKIFPPICVQCEHFNRVTRNSCRAYLNPDSIPDEIWNGQNTHTQPYPGDHGIQFKRVKG
jgi:hypothetical protein